MNITMIANAFVNTVGKLIEYEKQNNIRLSYKTDNNTYINFKPNDFKKTLRNIVKDDIDKYLEFFRVLDWIITSEQKRFSNVQWINKKAVRVVTIDHKKYKTLKKIISQK